jgi:hypothetical protein
MRRKGARKRCIRLLNEFKCALTDSRAPSSFVQAVKDGNRSALLFVDVDKSVQYVKKRIKKGSYVSHRHDPLLLHVFHLHYAVYLLAGRTEALASLFGALQTLTWSRWWLSATVKEDRALVQLLAPAVDDGLWLTWEKTRAMILRVLTREGDGDVLFQCCAMAYASKVLCLGHEKAPAVSSVFVALRRRELGGEPWRSVDRTSPTEFVRRQGQTWSPCGQCR